MKYQRMAIHRLLRYSGRLSATTLEPKSARLHLSRDFSVGGYIMDVFASGNLSPSNPILDAFEPHFDALNFKIMRPDHLTAAATKVQQEYEARLTELENRLEGGEIIGPSNLVDEIDALRKPVRTIYNVAALYAQIYPFNNQWIRACNAVQSTLTRRDEESRPIFNAVKAALNQDSSVAWELNYLLRAYETKGMDLDEETFESLKLLRQHIRTVESSFHSAEEQDPNAPGRPTKEVLQDLYTVNAMTMKEAEVLGHKDPVELHLADRAFLLPDIRSVHKEVSARAQTKIRDSSPLNASQTVDLRKHLTMDGTLGAMFALTRALFAVSIVEEKPANGWDHEVRLFHVTEEDSGERLGSFYMDPYFRPIKTRLHVMAPILEDPKTAFVSTTIRPPVWDHLPTEIGLEDAATLFHEFGHVLQFLLSQRSGLSGGGNVPLDLSEVLPQFMEHWLFEKSVLETLAHFSQSEDGIPEEAMDKATKERKLNKAHQLAHRVFLGELEFEYNMRSVDQEESIVAMQHRIATDHIGHNQPAKNDLDPLMGLVENNARDKRIAQYRYLLSEIVSADLFRSFKEIDANNQQDVRELGLRLRRLLLEPGALMSTSAIEEFTGRKISPEALFELYEM